MFVSEYSCVCNQISQHIRWNKEDYPDCKSCEAGQVVSRDGYFCISCGNFSQESHNLKTHGEANICMHCDANEILGKQML